MEHYTDLFVNHIYDNIQDRRFKDIDHLIKEIKSVAVDTISNHDKRLKLAKEIELDKLDLRKDITKDHIHLMGVIYEIGVKHLLNKTIDYIMNNDSLNKLIKYKEVS